jgi:hypothetical protein
MAAIPSSDRPGQRFHAFVATLERLFADRDGVSVASPLRLRDQDTGRFREHDVVITRLTHHGASLTALECRDHVRKVGVPQVEAFAKKCEKTGIHHGILVSASGFTETARTKAHALNLTCMELAEAERFAWIGSVTIVFQFSNCRSIDIMLRVAEGGARPLHPVSLYTSKDICFEGEAIQSAIMDRLPAKHRNLLISQVIEGAITASMEGYYVVDAMGQHFPVKDITFTYVIELEVTERAIMLHHYAGETAALEIASGQFDFPGGNSTIAMVKSGDGITGYILSNGGFEHRVRVGDLPERRLARTPVAGAARPILVLGT